MSVKRAQQEIDSEEFSEWAAYYRRDPFCSKRSDLRMARVCAVILNALASKQSQTVKEDQFLFEFGLKQQSTAEKNRQMAATFAMYARVHNRIVRRKQREERAKRG